MLAEIAAPVSPTAKDNAGLFQADPELLRKELQRMQRDLTLALEERNRLMKKLSQPSTAPGVPSEPRALDRHLEEQRVEVARLRREQRQLLEQHQRLEQQAGRKDRDYLNLVEQLEALAGLSTAENAAEPAATAQDRVKALTAALRRRLTARQGARDGMANHELERLRRALDDKQQELIAMARPRDELAGRLSAQEEQLRTQAELLTDRKSTRLNSSHNPASRMPSSA
jgi:chromosome segregation ATPase